MSYNLTCSVHKGTCANSHLGHNRQTIFVPHADISRRHLNICYKDEPLEDAYHYLFDDALAEYNKGKKPSRQIADYYQHIMEQYRKGEEKLQQAISSGASKKELRNIKQKYVKPYYELILTVGNMDAYDGAFACGGKNEKISVEILNRYMADFQKRNPHLYVFSAYLHMDEKTPHIHCCYIP